MTINGQATTIVTTGPKPVNPTFWYPGPHSSRLCGTRREGEAIAASEFVAWLEGVVVARGMSWRRLARETGVSHSTLSALRHGRAERPSVETCYRLASHLNHDFRQLLRLAGYEAAEVDVDIGDPELDLMFHGLLHLSPEEREPVKEFVRFTLARAADKRRSRPAS